MTRTPDAIDASAGSDDAAIAQSLLDAWDSGRCTERPSVRRPGLTLAQGFAVGEQLRQRRVARGERPVGWKIGFTNRSIWQRYGVYAPIWGPVYDTTTTVLDGSELRVSLAGLCQPRLEPEIAFGLARAPSPGMSLGELRACLAWVAHSFEIVHTHCEGWQFSAADCEADFALHGRLFIGPRRAVADWPTLGADLAALQVALHRDGVCQDRGQGAVVLDGPLSALKTWIDAMPLHSPWWQASAGDVVTTGTITDAQPLAPGQTWHTELSDARLSPLTLHTEA
jgi:2-oxo-3-hexenedioate decarboxylase